ncbi:PspC family transcriptional regulator, partial [Lactonifactor longoviformis]
NTWYYLNGSGAMQTGWYKVGNTWYYSSSSGAMQTGWQYLGGKWYYLRDSGAMASNTWVGRYYVNGSGVWT